MGTFWYCFLGGIMAEFESGRSLPSDTSVTLLPASDVFMTWYLCRATALPFEVHYITVHRKFATLTTSKNLVINCE